MQYFFLYRNVYIYSHPDVRDGVDHSGTGSSRLGIAIDQSGFSLVSSAVGTSEQSAAETFDCRGYCSPRCKINNKSQTNYVTFVNKILTSMSLDLIIYLNNLEYFVSFLNPSWLTSERTSGHQNLVSIFPGIDNCLVVTNC